MLVIVLLLACRSEKTPADTGAPPPTDDSAPDTYPESGSDPSILTLTLSTSDGRDGPVLLVLRPADGGEALSFSLGLGEQALEVPPGAYGLEAWRDDDGDGLWGGAWVEAPEPRALLGLTVPRAPLDLPLRAGVPEPVLEDDPAWVDLYHAAWTMAESHIGRGTPANGFADAWMDEAFSSQIFQWDTCFMTLFGQQGLDRFPVMASLDNFYGAASDDGYICRVVNEDDGAPGGDGSDPSEPMINPPLFATAELAYVRRTGDLSRLPRILPALDAYADWIDAHVRTDPGLYYTSMLGSGMDNAPRDEAYQGWVDITAQQALQRRDLGALYGLAGDAAEASAQQAEADAICEDVRALLWDEEVGWFFDLDPEGALLDQKNLAGVWPLVAGCATPAQAAAVIGWLTDPAAFWRVQPFASTSADAASFDPDGYYWRGGVWAPTNHMVGVALRAYGRRDVAVRANERQLEVMSGVYEGFVPAEGQLADDASGPGTETLWELYAPDAVAPGTRWDDTWLGRQDFVGWSGLTPIADLIELAVGLEPDAPTDQLTWHMHRMDAHGVEGYRFGDQLVDLHVEARQRADDELVLSLESSDEFKLVVELAGQTWSLDVPAGSSEQRLTPAGSRARALVPAGPFPGSAVLGNGQIAAVYTTADGTSDPPGLYHLYVGDHGADLLELGQTLVGQDGARVTGWITGLDPAFAAYAEVPLPDGAALVWRTFAAADLPAVVIDGALVAPDADTRAVVAPLVQLRAEPSIDGALSWEALDRDDDVLVAELSDGRALALGLSPAPEAWELGQVVADPVAGGLRDLAGEGRQLALATTLTASAGEEADFRQVIAVGASPEEAVERVNTLLVAEDPLGESGSLWADLLPGALCAGPACPTASANLIAAAASALGGAVPADLTGQFVTDERPQLYPRDAAMVARALIEAGRDDDALAIVRFWLGEDIDQPRAGEWYARYDALGRGVDGGTGAAFDTPEWDFNAYLALLVEELGADALDADERARVLDGLDLLVAEQDAQGLWTEGGIIEWEGRLPGTAMAAWAGLDAGARLADTWGESTRAAEYRAAAGRARGGLLELVDEVDPALGDARDGLITYDTSLLFGPVLGYPADPLLDLTAAWILDEARAFGGGVRYFEDPAGGTGTYGQDLFFFTTAAAAWYALSSGDPEADGLIDWMSAMTSVYGLAPERVYADGSGASVASPLSWCAAELALTLRLAEALPSGPEIDGLIAAPEYRQTGFAVTDHDGEPDEAGGMVALYATVGGSTLSLALRLAAPAEALHETYTLWLAEEAGTGPWTTGEGGGALRFRADPAETPGAVASIFIDLSASSCDLIGSDGASAPCEALALGQHGVELVVDLADVGLAAPVQLIAERTGDPTLLPAAGSLSTAGPSDEVLLTFEVDASALGALDGEVVTLSGDRDELGAWAGDAVALAPLGDGSWSVTLAVERGGWISYKYLHGAAGDGSWDGVEFDGDDRALRVEDLDGTGRVIVSDTFGVRGGAILDP